MASKTTSLLGALFVIIACLLTRSTTEAHGYMKSPRSRNWYASPNSGSKPRGTPPAEYCPHCLSRKQANEVCGTGQAQSYDNWIDNGGGPMSWTNEGSYHEGQEIIIDSVISVHHYGYIEVFACPNGNSSTQSCLNSHPLTFLEDLSHGGPRDIANPGRAYLPNQFATNMELRHRFRLPPGVSGDNVLLQWHYVTANDCNPPGMRQALAGRPNWLAHNGALDDCNSSQWPLDQTGTNRPEQFWNCADISISGGGGGNPNPPPVPTPTPPTPSSSGCCSWNGGQSCGTDSWCNGSRGNCEGSCSGRWVSRNGPPPTPPPSPSSCCSWNGGISCGDGPWCNRSRGNCVSGCSGQWVSRRGPTPAPRNCCSWNGGQSCGGGSWCNASRNNCVSGCSGQWV